MSLLSRLIKPSTPLEYWMNKQKSSNQGAEHDGSRIPLRFENVDHPLNGGQASFENVPIAHDQPGKPDPKDQRNVNLFGFEGQDDCYDGRKDR